MVIRQAHRHWGARSLVATLGLALALVALPFQPASGNDVEQRIADFWKRVDAMGPSDVLIAADLSQWALNVIERDPGAGLTVADFRAATSAMQQAFDRAGFGVPPGTPKSFDVEARIARFWQVLDGLAPTNVMTAADVGQWALNIADRDPNKRIRVDDFRASTAGMQVGFVRARSLPRPSAPLIARPTPTPSPSPIVVRRVEVVESGFATSTRGDEVVYGVRLRNLNALESASVTLQVAFYDAAGTLVKAIERSIGRVDAAQEIGYANTTYTAGTQVLTRMTVQIITNGWTTSAARPPLLASPGTYVPDAYGSSITGTVSTTYASNLPYVRVSVIGYDGSGRIVGGGYAFVTVPASGSATVQASYMGLAPTRSQLFAQVTCLTNFSWC